jgi:hypothetical protein
MVWVEMRWTRVVTRRALTIGVGMVQPQLPDSPDTGVAVVRTATADGNPSDTPHSNTGEQATDSLFSLLNRGQRREHVNQNTELRDTGTKTKYRY